jgi:Flp pilus assembly protein TadD
MKIFNAFVAGMIIVTGVTASAQSTGPPRPSSVNTNGSFTAGSIKGTVVGPDGRPLESAVRITLQDLRGSPSTTFTDNQGRFEMRGIAPGSYTLEAEGDRDLYDPGSVRLEVNRQETTLTTISLRQKANTRPVKANGTTVSVGESDAGVPAKARLEFQKASKAVREGRRDEGIEHLRNAISIYPAYLMAHNDLGAQLLEAGQLEEAQTELEVAIKIDPNSFNPHLNFGILLYREHRFAEALEKLDKAVSIKSDSAQAYFHRGMVQMALQNNEAAAKDLKTSYQLGGTAFSVALFYLGQLYLDLGQQREALESFSAFLKASPTSPKAAEAKRMVEMLAR